MYCLLFIVHHSLAFFRSGSDEDYEEKVGMLQTIYDLHHDAEQAKLEEAHQRDAMKRKMSTLNDDGTDLRLEAIQKRNSTGIQYCYIYVAQ